MNRRAHNFVNLVGKQFNKLTVMEEVGPNSNGGILWDCLCACGNRVSVLTAELKSGHTKSCGCYNIERTTKHGMHKSTEYIIWQQAKERCYNTNKASYGRYGARGIYMDDSWRNNFEQFFADMGPRPSKEHSLERVDNNGPYAAWNCIWTTKHEQYRNRRQTVWIEFNGERLCQKDWCRRFSLDEATFTARIRRGWDVEKALTTPAAKQRDKNC